MEQSQSDLCIEVLRRLDKAGLLKGIILVGSWCTLFYKDYFRDPEYMKPLVTRDVDLLIPRPRAIRTKTDVAELLKDIGFVVGFTGSQGYIRLEHPQLIVEFLVPEKRTRFRQTLCVTATWLKCPDPSVSGISFGEYDCRETRINNGYTAASGQFRIA